jgi:hypothetical protein
MRPKGKLFALFAVFAAIGLVTATGAFTTVNAERTVAVDVAGDDAALLGLAGNASNGNGGYVTGNNSEIVINLQSANLGDASGVNQNATTNISYMINVTNNGNQNINFSVDSGTDGKVVFYTGDDPVSGTNLTASNEVTINSGQQTSIGIQINTDSGDSSFNRTVTFTANAV